MQNVDREFSRPHSFCYTCRVCVTTKTRVFALLSAETRPKFSTRNTRKNSVVVVMSASPSLARRPVVVVVRAVPAVTVSPMP